MNVDRRRDWMPLESWIRRPTLSLSNWGQLEFTKHLFELSILTFFAAPDRHHPDQLGLVLPAAVGAAQDELV